MLFTSFGLSAFRGCYRSGQIVAFHHEMPSITRTSAMTPMVFGHQVHCPLLKTTHSLTGAQTPLWASERHSAATVDCRRTSQGGTTSAAVIFFSLYWDKLCDQGWRPLPSVSSVLMGVRWEVRGHHWGHRDEVSMKQVTETPFLCVCSSSHVPECLFFVHMGLWISISAEPCWFCCKPPECAVGARDLLPAFLHAYKFYVQQCRSENVVFLFVCFFGQWVFWHWSGVSIFSQ